MEARERTTQNWRFGVFEIDAKNLELRRSGAVVKVREQSFRVLVYLVERAGEIVSREDLYRALWPADTFVDFDHSLNTAVKKLRDALGDDADAPIYIETIPRRGYRFIAPVSKAEIDAAPKNGDAFIPEDTTEAQPATHSVGPQNVPVKRRVIAATSIVLVVAVAAMGVWRLFLHRPVLSAKDTVVLADFANSTGDPVFDGTLRQGMAVQLQQSPYLSLISDQRIRHTLGLMGMPGDVKLTPELARGVCDRTGSAAVLEGSIAKLGSEYVLGLRAKSCKTGETLGEEQAQAARKEDVLNALSAMASRFRKQVGESLATIDQHNTPLAEATTSSLEALETYTTAWKVHYMSGATAAMPLFKRAVEIDPNFAMAHAELGRTYQDVEEVGLSAESITRAWQLRERTSDLEKFYITAQYEALVTGNMEEARQTCEAWARSYPRDPAPATLLSGYVNKVAGRYEMALDWAKKAVELDPDSVFGHLNIGLNSMHLGRLNEAENASRLAAGRGLENDELVMLAYDLAFLKGDWAGMSQVADHARQRTGAEGWISNKEAVALAYYGRLKEARAATDRAVEYSEHARLAERAGLWEATAAVREALFGNANEAKQRAEAALKLSRNREVEFGAAFALARSGEMAQAEALAVDIEKRSPEDTSAQFNYLPTLKAVFALERRDAAKAVEELRIATPYELGQPRLFVWAMYPVYVRGEAYLAEGRGADAAAEFTKIVQHRGVVVSDPIGALARLQLGRAYQLAGDTVRAKQAYDDFLTLWKDADLGMPVLVEARGESGKL